MRIKEQVESLVKAHNEKIEALILGSDLSDYGKLELLNHLSDFTISQWYSEIYYQHNDLFIKLLEDRPRGDLMLWTHLYEIIEGEIAEGDAEYHDLIMAYANESENTFDAAKKCLLGLLFDSIVQHKELGFIINW